MPVLMCPLWASCCVHPILAKHEFEHDVEGGILKVLLDTERPPVCQLHLHLQQLHHLQHLGVDRRTDVVTQEAGGHDILNELTVRSELVACSVDTMERAHARHALGKERRLIKLPAAHQDILALTEVGQKDPRLGEGADEHLTDG